MKTVGWRKMHAYFVRFVIGLAGVFITHCSFAQLIEDRKISPALSREVRNSKITVKLLLEVAIKNDKVPNEIWKPVYQTQKLFESSTFSVYRLFATSEEINSILLPLPGVIFIEKGHRVAKEEIQVGNLDQSVNKINLAHRNFPLVNGDGITVSVKENKPDTTDIDFKGRFLSTNLSSTTISSHASIMSTMIA